MPAGAREVHGAGTLGLWLGQGALTRSHKLHSNHPPTPRQAAGRGAKPGAVRGARVLTARLPLERQLTLF